MARRHRTADEGRIELRLARPESLGNPNPLPAAPTPEPAPSGLTTTQGPPPDVAPDLAELTHIEASSPLRGTCTPRNAQVTRQATTRRRRCRVSLPSQAPPSCWAWHPLAAVIRSRQHFQHRAVLARRLACVTSEGNHSGRSPVEVTLPIRHSPRMVPKESKSWS